MDVPDSVSIKEYFDEYVPKIFAEQVGGGAILGMDGTVLGLQFDIGDGEKQTYGLVVKDAKDLEVKEGAIDNPTVKLEMTEDTWRKAVTGKMGGVTDTFTDVSQISRNKYDQLQNVKGTLSLDLALPDGSDAQIKVVFNNSDSPATTFKCAQDDWVAMSSGQLAGPTAFMSGKLKIEGDMAFAMGLSSLVG